MSIEDDRIEQLKRKLYSRNEEPVLDMRSPIAEHDSQNGLGASNHTWGDTKLHIPDDMATNRTHPFLKKFLFGAGLFFVLALGIASYIYFGGGNFVSANNVDIKITGPSSIASGQAVDLSVSVVNQNSTGLEFASLAVDYPDGTKSGADSSAPLTHDSQDIGTIKAGSSADRAVSAYFFGDKGVTRTVKFTLSYKLSGSNAVFTKQKTYDLGIASSPVIVQVSGPTSINSGQQVTFTGTVTSNSSAVLKNILLQADYPYGFMLQSSSITSIGGKQNLWNLGDIKSGDTKNFSITGTLTAQDGEQRTFQFTVGTQSNDPTKNIDTNLSQAAQTVTVRKPFINATLSLSGSEGASNSDSVAIKAGDNVVGTINFTNTLAEPLNNVVVAAQISGTAFDRASAQGDNGGFYQSTSNSITWNKNILPAFTQLSTGDTQSLGFSFNTLRLPTSAKNPSVDVTVTITGSHEASDGSTGDINTVLKKSVKINANLALVSKVLRGGPMTNSGPVPPRAEMPSTYTIDWILTNTWNDISGAKVTAVLPPSVEWTGNVSPSTAPISYNADSRTVTWSPDAVSAGAGFSLSPKEAFFQVKITPSLSQVGGPVTIISAPQVSAHDTFSGATLSFSSQPLTTQTSDTGNAGIVTQ